MPADHPAGKVGKLNRRACPGGQSGCGLMGVRAGGKAESKAVQQRQATGGFEKFNVRYKMYKVYMSKIKWFIVGLHLYVFPPDPEVGDLKALHNWKPRKMGIIETIKFRFNTGIWSYTARNY